MKPRDTEPRAEALTVRQAARKRQPLDGADAQALEHALTQADEELLRLRARERALTELLEGIAEYQIDRLPELWRQRIRAALEKP